MEKKELDELGSRIVVCKKCPRLRGYCLEVARKKVRRYRNSEYWGKPVPGFGDYGAELLVIGLAPAAHGANRTGRMFTGDSSGEWLIMALHEVGFANQGKTQSRGDGLKLKSVYLTAVVRCAPPSNRPTRDEIRNCSEYLHEELRILRNVKVVLTLGRIAFDTYLGQLRSMGCSLKLKFRHGSFYELPEGFPILACSYHPSRQNTQTGKLKWEDWTTVFRDIRKTIDTIKVRRF